MDKKRIKKDFFLGCGAVVIFNLIAISTIKVTTGSLPDIPTIVGAGTLSSFLIPLVMAANGLNAINEKFHSNSNITKKKFL